MRARIARRGSRAAPARLGGARFERRREPAWRRCDRDRVVAAMEVGRANRTFFLYVGDFAIGVDVLITSDDAAAIECGESEEANNAHTTTLAVGSPTDAALMQRIAASQRTLQPMRAIMQSASQFAIARMAASPADHRIPQLRNHRRLRRIYALNCGNVPRNVT